MRITRDEATMRHARLVAERGTCSRLQVGAVVVRDGRILVTGYNGTPAGMPHCEHFGERTPCADAVHAEENCIAYAAKWGIALDGAELFSTDSPCLRCAQLIVNSGIVRVVYERQYRLTEGIDLLRAVGVRTESFASKLPSE